MAIDYFGTEMMNGFFGGFIGALVAVGLLFAILAAVAVYIYFALALRTIGQKLKYHTPNLAWIPFANLAMMLQMGGFHWAWIFLILIPIVGWIALLVLLVISNWRIFERRNYPGWFSLSMILPKIGTLLYLVALGFVAWKDKKRR